MDAAKGMWLFYENPEADFEDLRLKFADIRKRVYKFPKLGRKATADSARKEFERFLEEK